MSESFHPHHAFMSVQDIIAYDEITGFPSVCWIELEQFLDIPPGGIIIPQRWGPDGEGAPGPFTRYN